MSGPVARQTFCKLPALQFWLAALLSATLAMQAVAQPFDTGSSQQTQLLNSERIAQKFGNYGIAVLESDSSIRVSNLYSTSTEQRICRTFAIVHYPEHVDPEYAAEHRLILDGGSIGAVFAAHDWVVEKTHRYYGEVRATDRVAELMHIPAGTSLAIHVYLFAVAKAGVTLDYATIVEVHHPDYLHVQDLPAIYGPLAAAQSASATAEILEIAQTKMR